MTFHIITSDGNNSPWLHLITNPQGIIIAYDISLTFVEDDKLMAVIL